tara:strand:- start:5130 stop:5981 length:852 start_codon:yes stop_codon:yes gene_type:complete
MNEPREPHRQGTLYLVATPIGNLGDITQRACEILEEVQVVACEDTRQTGKLLKLLGLQAKRLLIANEHNEASIGPTVVELLSQGNDIALVSDAGTPAISDPGERLVKHVTDNGHRVSVVPGASAAIAALTLSGLPTKRWAMEGFLPRKGQERTLHLESIGSADRTSVLFESPKRLHKTLLDLIEVCGPDRPAAVLRELTKLHEECARGTLEELTQRFSGEAKGEIVIVIGAAKLPEVTDQTILDALEVERANGTKLSSAVIQVSTSLGIQRNRVYALAHPTKE